MGIFGKKNITAPVQVRLDTSQPAPEKAPVGSMVSLRKEASVSLRKHEVEGKGVKVYLVLDNSGSMSPWYRNDSVQRITAQALALGAELDDDGSIEAWYYGSKVSDVYQISLDTGSPSSYVGWVDRTQAGAPGGLTNTAEAVRTVADFHKRNGGGLPGLVVFQTDGSPYTGQGNARRDTEDALRRASHDVEELFFAFVGFGTEATVDFLFKLDGLTGRKRDNASAMAVEDFRLITDSQLFDGVLKEFTTEFLPGLLGQ